MFFSGQRLEITDNILSTSNVLDISSFGDVAIRCNRASEFESLSSDCSTPTDHDGLPYRIPSDNLSGELILFVIIVNVFCHVWIAVVAIAFVVVAVYKFSVGSNEYDDPPNSAMQPRHQFFSDQPSSCHFDHFSPATDGTGIRLDLLKELDTNPRPRPRPSTTCPSCLRASSVQLPDQDNYRQGKNSILKVL